jgi:hypothetical protein
MLKTIVCTAIKVFIAGFFGYITSVVYIGPGATAIAGIVGSLGVSSAEYAASLIVREKSEGIKTHV